MAVEVVVEVVALVVVVVVMAVVMAVEVVAAVVGGGAMRRRAPLMSSGSFSLFLYTISSDSSFAPSFSS